MHENGTLSARQFMMVVFLYIIGSTILIVPAGLAAEAKQDAWIPATMGVGIGVLVIWLYTTVGSFRPDLNFIDLNVQLLGKWLGRTVSLLIIATALISSADVLYYLGDFMATQMTPETPVAAIHILFFMIVMMGVRLGIETLARTAEILVPWFIMLFCFLVIFVVPELKVENIQPMFETGAKPISRGILSFLSISYLPLVYMLMIFPYVKNLKEARKAFFAGSFLGGLVLVVIIALSILVLDPDLSARQRFPSYVLARKINIGNFLQRVEAIVAAMWYISLYFRIAFYFFVAVTGIAQICQLKDYRPLVLPLGMITIVLSLIVFPSVTYQQTWDTKIWTPYIILVGFFYPLLLAVMAAIRKKRRTGTAEHQHVSGR